MAFDSEKFYLPFHVKENQHLVQFNLAGGEKMYCQMDENNQRQGDFVLFDAKGRKEAQGNFKNDMLEGKFSEFFPSGKLKAVYFFHKDLQVGQYTEFYELGQIATQGELDAQGKKTGVWTLYDEDGALEAESTYKNDMLNGESLIYENGILREKRQYVNNVREGIQFEYYDNGVLKSQNVYRNGKLNGPNVDYYESGHKMLVNHYENGEPVGSYTYYFEENGWYEKGTLNKDGVMDGVITFYGADDTPREEYTYKDGVLEGRTTYYWADGTKKLSIVYRDGKAITKGTMIYVPDGSILAHNGKKYEQVWPKKLPPLLSAVKERQR